jgi:hypothetical protein
MSQPSARRSGYPSDLAGLLAPVDVDSFLSKIWGKEFRHIPGNPGKFAELLPWSALNRILEQHRLEPPRLRLTREGQPVPATSYTTFQASRKKNGNGIPRLLAPEFQRHLRDGATLILDAVDELHSPITDLAEALESVFRVRVQVNAYAGWRTSHGFDLHWDDHDVLVLQIAGRKRWKVWGMTRKFPLAKDIERALPPEGDPLWDGLLSDGDLLYIPRGWWHLAMPLDEPTLHLTVGVNNPTGADLLAWFVDRLRSSEQVRQDLPVFADAPARRAAGERLIEVLANGWSANIIDEYLDEADAKSRPRARISLPWAAMPDVVPETGDVRVRWTGARRPRIDRTEEGVAIATHGRRWKFSAKAEPLLALLTSERSCTSGELEAAGGDTLDKGTVRAFLRELVDAGLVAIESNRNA